jgi:hypothetical protein
MAYMDNTENRYRYCGTSYLTIQHYPPQKTNKKPSTLLHFRVDLMDSLVANLIIQKKTQEHHAQNKSRQQSKSNPTSTE